jgi:mannosyltransferase OCH1-like enzyme
VTFRVTNLAREFRHQIQIRAPRPYGFLAGELPLRSCDLSQSAERSDWVIPNVVYQTWETQRFGRTHLRGLRAFRERNSDCSFEFFTREAREQYMAAQYSGTQIYDIYRAVRFGPMKADIWRYCILYARGGIYCDIDTAIAVPIRDIISPTASAVIAYENNRIDFEASTAVKAKLDHPDRAMANWGLMFAPEHPLLRQVIDGISSKYATHRGRVFAKPKQAILRFTGPFHLTECLHRFAQQNDLADIHQAGIDFHGQVIHDLPGSYVRYVEHTGYASAADEVIVD